MKVCEFIEYKGKEYRTLNEVIAAYCNGEIEDDDFDGFADMVAILCEGKKPTKKYYDYWGDEVAINPKGMTCIITENAKSKKGEVK